MDGSTKRFLFSRIIYLLHKCMFLACCFRQGTFCNLISFCLDVA